MKIDKKIKKLNLLNTGENADYSAKVSQIGKGAKLDSLRALDSLHFERNVSAKIQNQTFRLMVSIRYM